LSKNKKKPSFKDSQQVTTIKVSIFLKKNYDSFYKQVFKIIRNCDNILLKKIVTLFVL
jgi:hypothetical protein